jgi:hypothetical protein
MQSATEHSIIKWTKKETTEQKALISCRILPLSNFWNGLKKNSLQANYFSLLTTLATHHECWYFHGSVVKDSALLGCDMVSLGNWFPVLQRNITYCIHCQLYRSPQRMPDSMLRLEIRQPFQPVIQLPFNMWPDLQLLLYYCRWFQWPRGLGRRSAAARQLKLWVRIPPETRMSVCCECCVCCLVEVSTMSWSLIQSSPIDCGA